VRKGRALSLQARYEFSRINLQRLGKQENVVERDVPLAALDPADVVAVQSGRFAQCFLGVAPFGP